MRSASLHWQPTASFTVLRLRSQLYQTIRSFFTARGVWEVETPLLSGATVPEVQIANFCTHFHGNTLRPLFLQTSPETQMKRLLAAGSGAIFQICKVFRDGEVGRLHNPEFTMLEWYRPQFTQADLIAEIGELLEKVLQSLPIQRISYCEAFEKYVGIHPLKSQLSELHALASGSGMHEAARLNRDECLQWLVAQHVEPMLGWEAPCALSDFPASQAALARKNPHNPELAERFEIYVEGVELANGFHELTDPVEQRQRFMADLAQRQALGLPTYPLDEYFLAALQAGMPTCSGVAMGLDRLLMLQTKIDKIEAVIAFPIDYV